VILPSQAGPSRPARSAPAAAARRGVARLAAGLAAVAVSAAALSGAQRAGAVEPDRVGRVIQALGTRTLVVRVTIGEVRIEGGPEDRVELQVTRLGEAARTPDRLPVTIEEGAETVTLAAEQAAGGREPGLRVRASVRMPSGGALRAEVFEGTLDLSGLAGRTTARIERGPLNARGLSGIVRLETGSGALTIEQAELAPGGLLRGRTFNGDIRVSLRRRPADARVLLLTLNGTIASDFPLEERAGFGPRFREGVFGRGEPLLSLDAVRGDIVLQVPPR
jgi:hypothetical protein